MGLTPEQTQIVKATAPILELHGEAITTVFYHNLLEAEPELKNIFNLTNQRTGAQQRVLAGAILAYARNIDDLPRLAKSVEHIAQRHASLYVQPGQYEIVGRHLIGAIGQVLGDSCTEEIVDAWTAAYQQLASVFISREAQLYDASPSGWTDWRRFKIVKRVKESDVITSFHLSPVDASSLLPLPSYKPGQYVGVRIPIPELGGLRQIRHYSLSDAPHGIHQENGSIRSLSSSTYRISVKKEQSAGNNGLVSNHLHDHYNVDDEVELSAPRGDFVLDDDDNADPDRTPTTAPLVFISAGVGITPMMSMLRTSTTRSPTKKSKKRPITWIHTARTRESAAFMSDVRDITAGDSNVCARIFLSHELKPEPAQMQMDTAAVDDDENRFTVSLGLLDLQSKDLRGLLHLSSDDKTQYFICGPGPWMADTREVLRELGVGAEAIHLEVFGTGDVALKI